MKRQRLSLFLLFFSALILWTAPNALAQPLATPAEAARRIGLSDAAIARVNNGEVVAEELEASSDKDLSLAVVARIAADLDTVHEFVRADRLAEFQTVTLDRGPIDPANPSLVALELPEEMLKKLASDPGDLFYMSEKEAQSVEAAGKQGTAAALAAYQKVLAERARSYWERGIDAIEPYMGKGRSPKIDLRHANEAARRLVLNPDFQTELDAIPAKAAGNAEHRLYWALQKGRDQLAPVLIHRILDKKESGELIIERRFYSGYDYDSMQIVVGVLSARTGHCAIFYMNHTYTAQVAGFGGGAKRSIGRKLLKKELIAEMQRAQKAIP